MNPQWNTPPNGDFARYVERLSAQSALPRRPPEEREQDFEVDATSSSAPHDAAAAAKAASRNAARRRAASNGEEQQAAAAPGNLIAKVAGAAGLLLLLVLWSLGVSIGTLVALAALGIWGGYKLMKVASPTGVAKWQRVLEEAARKQQEQKRQDS
jgi:hypothetical protein